MDKRSSIGEVGEGGEMMRYFKVYKSGKYVGKCKSNFNELVNKWVEDMEYLHIEVTKEEYENSILDKEGK